MSAEEHITLAEREKWEHELNWLRRKIDIYQKALNKIAWVVGNEPRSTQIARDSLFKAPH